MREVTGGDIVRCISTGDEVTGVMGTTGTTSVVFTGTAPLVGTAFNVALGPESIGAVTMKPGALRGVGTAIAGGCVGARIGDVMPDGGLSGSGHNIGINHSCIPVVSRRGGMAEAE